MEPLGLGQGIRLEEPDRIGEIHDVSTERTQSPTSTRVRGQVQFKLRLLTGVTGHTRAVLVSDITLSFDTPSISAIEMYPRSSSACWVSASQHMHEDASWKSAEAIPAMLVERIRIDTKDGAPYKMG